MRTQNASRNWGFVSWLLASAAALTIFTPTIMMPVQKRRDAAQSARDDAQEGSTFANHTLTALETNLTQAQQDLVDAGRSETAYPAFLNSLSSLYNTLNNNTISTEERLADSLGIQLDLPPESQLVNSSIKVEQRVCVAWNIYGNCKTYNLEFVPAALTTTRVFEGPSWASYTNSSIRPYTFLNGVFQRSLKGQIDSESQLGPLIQISQDPLAYSQVATEFESTTLSYSGPKGESTNFAISGVNLDPSTISAYLLNSFVNLTSLALTIAQGPLGLALIINAAETLRNVTIPSLNNSIPVALNNVHLWADYLAGNVTAYDKAHDDYVAGLKLYLPLVLFLPIGVAFLVYSAVKSQQPSEPSESSALLVDAPGGPRSTSSIRNA